MRRGFKRVQAIALALILIIPINVPVFGIEINDEYVLTDDITVESEDDILEEVISDDELIEIEELTDDVISEDEIITEDIIVSGNEIISDNNITESENNIDTATLTDIMVSEIEPQVFREGGVKPKVEVKNGELVLRENQDYTVSYNNNMKVGSATATITGIGSYSGTVVRHFSITPKIITANMISTHTIVYDGRNHADNIIVTNNGVRVPETQYTVTYSSTPCDAGHYIATVKGKNNYDGTVEKSFNIEVSQLNDAMVKIDTSSVRYTGSAIKPEVKVMYGATVLPESDYLVTYKDNVYAGTATILVEGKKNLKGSVERQFEITAIPISSARVLVNEVYYTGTEQRPQVAVILDDKDLILNRDYTVEYFNNIEASNEAKVVVTGCGGYEGVINKNFTILAKRIDKITVEGKADKASIVVRAGNIIIDEADYDFSFKESDSEEYPLKFEYGKTYDVNVTLKNNFSGTFTIHNVKVKTDVEILSISLKNDAPVSFTGKAIKPEVIVLGTDGKAVAKKYYTLAYANNVNAGIGTVSVLGKGDFTGGKSISFTILPKNLTEKDIKQFANQKYTGKEIKPAVSIKGLKLNKDFTVQYYNNIDVSYNMENEPYAGAFAEIDFSENYRVNGNPYYVMHYMITPIPINSVVTKPGYYRGEGLSVIPSSIKVKAGKFALTDRDYSVSYSGNTVVTSKAKVTVTAAKGNYCGSKTVSYKITKQPVSTMKISVRNDYSYTGLQIKPEVTVIDDYGSQAVVLSDYTLVYGKNINAGTGTVTIKSTKTGRYTGSITKKIKIYPAAINETVVCSGLPDKGYAGKAVKYTENEIGSAVKEVLSEKPISSKGYTVSYRNNTLVCDKIAENCPALILKGKGNYTGTLEIPFSIVKGSMNGAKISMEKTAKYKQGEPVYPKISSVVVNGRKLTKDVDFSLSYLNNKEKGEATVTFTGIGNYQGSKSLVYTIK